MFNNYNSKMFEAYCKIYRRDDNICDFCGLEIEKGKVRIIDRMQCHLSCYGDDVRKKEEKIEYRTWENWCLLKLKELGRTTMKKWAEAMGYKNNFNMNKLVKNNLDKLKITKSSTSRLKFYEVKEEEKNGI